MKLFLFLLIIIIQFNQAKSQDTIAKPNIALFEGRVYYVLQVLNPNKGLIKDEDFYRDIPNGGKSIVTFFIKGNRYKWEFEDRTEIFNPRTNQIAIISKRKQDSIYYAYASLAEDPIEKITKLNTTKKNLGHDLIEFEIITKWDTRTFYYSPVALKTQSSFWKNHKFNFLAEFIAASKNFPLIIQQQSMLGNWILTASKIEPMSIEDSIFQIPK